MSLVVWLPLTGTLENKGCSNCKISIARGTSVYTTGKIGQCFYNNGVNTINIENSVPLLYNKPGYSLCAWFYIETNNTVHSGSAIVSAGDWNSQVLNLSVSDWSSDHYTKLRVSGTNWNKTYNYTFNKNTWYHGVVCSDGTKTYAYINGNLIGNTIEGFLPSNISGNNIFIGGATYYSGMQFFGRINDVRIYDHCLSAAEVHEISQGLVLHYKLDGLGRGNFGNPNLALGSNTNSTSTNRWGGHSAVGGNTSTIEVDESGTNCVKVTRDATAQSSWDYLSYDNFNRGAIKVNTTYTVSFDCKPSVDGSIGFTGLLNGNATNYMTSSTSTIQGTCKANQWNHMIFQCVTKSSFSDISVSGQVIYFSRSASLRGINTTVLFKNIKLEEGAIDTPWCPADTEQTIDRTTIIDSSGYGHNGIINDTTLKLVSDTARYSTAIQNSQANNSATFPFKGQVDMPDSSALTFSWWMKPTAWGHQTSGIFSTSAGDSPTDYNTTAANMRDSCFDCCNINGTCVRINVASYLTLNEWHHYALTYNGSQLNFYKDGVSKVTASQSGSLKAFKNIFPFYSKAGGVNRCTSGSLSDFRIYATALSAADIKQLYEIGAKVDNLGNWHTFEFKETNGIAKIKKTGITEANEIYDNMNFNNRAQIVKNNAKVLIAGDLNIVTTYSSSVKTGTMPSLSGATVQALAGKTLRFIYDVCAPGTRYSAEQGQTAWSYTRYGIHGGCSLDGSTSYPFAGQLNYSGNSFHAIQTWTIPTGKSTYGDLGFSIQNFDKPASTNNATWFIRNVRLELVDGTSENITGTNLIEF